ncbi:hypothetical protein QFW77_08040 [Luteimonas sp. RD2P54]|uniref:Yip1 domain-containing protein n=1 Tax=Luteimonas endophytica TaxID=3042023 RepID=A0ABT6J9R4_9GAMM|nr:hypothetical protein [Luteimonas endophytica]MDH5822938.1 hypothetical protein [Luteimonas endophytica]
MPNPWLRFLILRGPLQALPPAWPPTLLLWGLAMAAAGLVAPRAPGAASPMFALAAVEIALCALLLSAAGRLALLLPALQALAMAALARTAAALPLLWLATRPPPAPDSAGALLLAAAGVLALEAALLVWLLRYWYRLWREALLASRARVAAITAGMAAAGLLLHLGLGW